VGSDLHAFFASRWPPEQADELLQETLVGIAQGLMSVRAKADAEFWSWCYRIARNKHADQCRNKSAAKDDLFDPQEMEQTVAASAVRVPISPGERLDLVYAMNLLRAAEPPCYDYLWSYYILGLEYEDIKGLDSLSRDTARMRVKRCLESAQDLMAKHP
jgi:DNA-directed RNA polymerase specialized sigma24 family protein